jgi:hypothetical protein
MVNPYCCLSFLLLFRCVFEAMFKVKVNLGFHKYVDGGPILDVPSRVMCWLISKGYRYFGK